MYKHRKDEEESKSENKEMAKQVEDLKIEIESLKRTVLKQKEELDKCENETKLKLEELKVKVIEQNERNEKKDKLIKSLRDKLKQGGQKEKETNVKLSELETTIEGKDKAIKVLKAAINKVRVDNLEYLRKVELLGMGSNHPLVSASRDYVLTRQSGDPSSAD